MEQLVDRAHRSKYIKQYFIIIGALCIIVVCLLFLFLDFGLTNNTNQSIVGNNRDDRAAFVRRYRRNTDEAKVRQKRREYLDMIEELKGVSQRCKESPNPSPSCQSFFKQLEGMGELLAIKAEQMKKSHAESNGIDGDDDEDVRNEHDNHMHGHKITNNVDNIQFNPKIHEALDSMRHEPWSLEREKSMLDGSHHRSENLMPFAVQPDASAMEKMREKSDDKVITPLKSPGFGTTHKYFIFQRNMFGFNERWTISKTRL